LYLCPLSLERKGKIRSFITFVNNADFIRAINTDSINIELDPFSIERKIVPQSEIKRFLEKPWIKKANKSTLIIEVINPIILFCIFPAIPAIRLIIKETMTGMKILFRSLGDVHIIVRCALFQLIWAHVFVLGR